MPRLALALVLLLMPASLTMSAASSPADSKRPAYAKGVDLAGVVSTDRKSILADDDNAWRVDNADALKGFEGRHVTVKCRMDPGKGAIRVLYVVQPSTGHSANLRDSAFRR
jgi:hypothetical protein